MAMNGPLSGSQAADLPEGDAAGLDAFIGKRHARWPEWDIAEVFLPAPQRPLARAWLTLLQELGDAAWGGGDALPGQAKLAWWHDELQGWNQRRRRHPLAPALLARPASWAALATALPALRDSRERPGDSTEAVAVLAPFAVAAAAVEAELFEVPEASTASGDLASALLAERLLHHRDGAAPLQALAQAGGQATRAWAAALLASWPQGAPVARARRLQALLQRARLEQLAAGATVPQPLSRWRTLWRGWQAARRG